MRSEREGLSRTRPGQEAVPSPQNLSYRVEDVLQRVRKALDGLEFGEVVLKVQGGKVVFVDRYERERVG